MGLHKPSRKERQIGWSQRPRDEKHNQVIYIQKKLRVFGSKAKWKDKKQGLNHLILLILSQILTTLFHPHFTWIIFFLEFVEEKGKILIITPSLAIQFIMRSYLDKFIHFSWFAVHAYIPWKFFVSKLFRHEHTWDNLGIECWESIPWG